MPLAFAFLTGWGFFLLLLFVGGLAVYAQIKVTSSMQKYGQVRARAGLTGAEAAREILNAADIHDVEIEVGQSFLGDHYDPTQRKLVLSNDIANGESVAALGVAAHECGHAIQHKLHYAPLKARMAVVPATLFASQMIPIIWIGGFLFGQRMFLPLIDLGIVAYAILTVFQLITLPVEFDASRRAKIILKQMGMITADEAPAVSKMLGAAAMTYVAAFLSTLVYLLHFIALRNSRD